MNREPVPIEPRRALTRKEYLHLAIDQNGRCGCGCGVKLDAMKEGVRDEHRIPLAQGGTNALPNRELWRQPCSAAKDKRDAKDTAKCKRIEARETGTRRERPPIPSRGFDKTLTKGFDGKVRPRAAK
jgi:hypothetical protein